MSLPGRVVVLVTLLAAMVLAGCSGDEPATNPLAADTAFKPNTDAVAGRLTKKQVDQIVEKCRQNAGIPGGNGDCAAALPQSLAPCRPTDRWCLTGDVTVRGGELQIVDQRGDEPTCDPRMCGRIEVPGRLVDDLVRGQDVSRSAVPTLDPAPTETTPSSDTPGASGSPSGDPPESTATQGLAPEDPSTTATP